VQACKSASDLLKGFNAAVEGSVLGFQLCDLLPM
jgi:hypothetical protein